MTDSITLVEAIIKDPWIAPNPPIEFDMFDSKTEYNIYAAGDNLFQFIKTWSLIFQVNTDQHRNTTETGHVHLFSDFQQTNLALLNGFNFHFNGYHKFLQELRVIEITANAIQLAEFRQKLQLPFYRLCLQNSQHTSAALRELFELSALADWLRSLGIYKMSASVSYQKQIAQIQKIELPPNYFIKPDSIHANVLVAMLENNITRLENGKSQAEILEMASGKPSENGKKDGRHIFKKLRDLGLVATGQNSNPSYLTPEGIKSAERYSSSA